MKIYAVVLVCSSTSFDNKAFFPSLIEGSTVNIVITAQLAIRYTYCQYPIELMTVNQSLI